MQNKWLFRSYALAPKSIRLLLTFQFASVTAHFIKQVCSLAPKTQLRSADMRSKVCTDSFVLTRMPDEATYRIGWTTAQESLADSAGHRLKGIQCNLLFPVWLKLGSSFVIEVIFLLFPCVSVAVPRWQSWLTSP